MGKRNWFAIVTVICLFFGIPIHVKKKNDAPTYESLFKEYIVKCNKTYGSEGDEYAKRFENFKNSLKIIEELNRNRSSNESALYGLTEFSDLSQEEFVRYRLQTNRSDDLLIELLKNSTGFRGAEENASAIERRKQSGNRAEKSARLKRALAKLPPVTDWRERNVVGSVHNQQKCGACWAFSAIETVESMNAIKNRTFSPLSVQEVIDCAKDGNYGCEGGDSCLLLNWLVSTKTKITTEKAYPFAYHTQTCKLKLPRIGVQVKSFDCEDFSDAEELLLEKLAYHGPLAVAVNALNWQFYLGGIIQFHCSGLRRDLNHAVQIVGYDSTGPVPHYIVRNSWGTEFGNSGYLYIAIGGNVCGIANEVASLDVV